MFAKEALNGSDEEMRELAKMELPELEEKKRQPGKRADQVVDSKDPQDDKNAVLKFVPAPVAMRASLFAGDLLNMYLRYCGKKDGKPRL